MQLFRTYLRGGRESLFDRGSSWLLRSSFGISGIEIVVVRVVRIVVVLGVVAGFYTKKRTRKCN